MLNKVDKSKYYISNDLFLSVVKKDKAREKEKFLKGKEGVDF